MYKKLQKKFISTSIKTKCNITIEIQRLEDLPQVVKQLKVVWEKDGKVKAESDVCAVHKGKNLISHVPERGPAMSGDLCQFAEFQPVASYGRRAGD